MVLASILLTCAKVAFLAQYYVLLCLIVLRNIWKRIFSISLNRCGNIFSHPRHEVNQDVFSHTRISFVYLRWFSPTWTVYIRHLLMPNLRWRIRYFMEDPPWRCFKIEWSESHFNSARTLRLRNVMVPAWRQVFF